jgi:RimJ/RimL family protein N-acetyltransferase
MLTQLSTGCAALVVNGTMGSAPLTAIDRLKNTPQAGKLPICDSEGNVIGTLIPITVAMAYDESLLEDLCRWRAENMSNFLTVFEPTVAKTRDYLLRLSLPDPARILFVIHDDGGRRVGNIGLCNVSETEAEVDNVIRGEPVTCSRFMLSVQSSLAGWVFNTLGLKLLYLKVLTDNLRAIKSYERAGFSITGRQPLMKKPIPGGYQLIPASVGAPECAAFVRMELDRSSFWKAGLPSL